VLKRLIDEEYTLSFFGIKEPAVFGI
jgi:hypothetical protein